MAVDDDFFGRVGHDLRGELATMLAGVHFLLRYEQGLGGTAREMLDRVNGAGQRLKRLLDEFGNCVWLDDSVEHELAREPCDLVKLCAAAIERVARSAAARNVSPSVEVSHAGLDGDAELLTIALEYVVDFAVTRSRDQRITVRGAIEGGHAVVTVGDEAGSVPEEHIRHLLQPFKEKKTIPRETPARRRERLGLGLAIADGILRAHSGGLSVDAAPGAKGLVFRCDLGPAV